jgi:ferredoxin
MGIDSNFILINCIINSQTLSLLCPMGFSLMQCLKMEANHDKISALVDNIAATCGGNMSCSTCMVKISPNWIEPLCSYSPLTAEENIFIDMFLDQNNIDNYQEGEYRLSCQIKIMEEINNLEIYFITDGAY